MKKHLFSFLFGGLTFLCIGAGVATSTDILTVKPATPKTFIVKSFKNEGNSEAPAEFIKSKMSEGFILKSVEGANRGTSMSTWVVIMEEY